MSGCTWPGPLAIPSIRAMSPPRYDPRVIRYEWRGPFTNEGANTLHAECFDHEPRQDDWWGQVNKHSRLGLRMGWGRSSSAL
jgi:hypothetical protein